MFAAMSSQINIPPASRVWPRKGLAWVAYRQSVGLGVEVTTTRSEDIRPLPSSNQAAKITKAMKLYCVMPRRKEGAPPIDLEGSSDWFLNEADPMSKFIFGIGPHWEWPTAGLSRSRCGDLFCRIVHRAYRNMSEMDNVSVEAFWETITAGVSWANGGIVHPRSIFHLVLALCAARIAYLAETGETIGYRQDPNDLMHGELNLIDSLDMFITKLHTVKTRVSFTLAPGNTFEGSMYTLYTLGMHQLREGSGFNMSRLINDIHHLTITAN